MYFLCVGMQKVVHSSEGVRESLRRLSNVSWMAEELHKVADYYLPNMSVSRLGTSPWSVKHLEILTLILMLVRAAYLLCSHANSGGRSQMQWSCNCSHLL